LVPKPCIEHENFCNDEDTDGDKAEGADAGENFLQMAGSVIILSDE
jgi:hypothetical protein